MGCDYYFLERDKDREAVYTCNTLAGYLATFCKSMRDQGIQCPLKDECPGQRLYLGEDVCAVGLWDSEWIRAAELKNSRG